MKITLIGYKFLEKEIATGARSELVSVKELPKKKGDVTIYWQNYEKAALDEPAFFYMLADESMITTLGKPSKFQITVPDPPKEESEEGGDKIPLKGK